MQDRSVSLILVFDWIEEKFSTREPNLHLCSKEALFFNDWSIPIVLM